MILPLRPRRYGHHNPVVLVVVKGLVLCAGCVLMTRGQDAKAYPHKNDRALSTLSISPCILTGAATGWSHCETPGPSIRPAASKLPTIPAKATIPASSAARRHKYQGYPANSSKLIIWASYFPWAPRRPALWHPAAWAARHRACARV